MKYALPLLMSLFAINSFAVDVAPSAVCNAVLSLKNLVLKSGRSCDNLTAKLLNQYVNQLSFISDSAKVCGRNQAVVAQILKITGQKSCADVTPVDLAKIFEFYVEGTGPKPVKSIRNLALGDLKGLFNATSVVFEYTYLETVEPGAFSDLKSVSNIELSHTRISYLRPDTFCKNGVYGLPSLKTMDLDSNRPFKGGTIETNLLSCLSNLEDIDFDTDELTHFTEGTFAGNKKLKKMDLKNNPGMSTSEINYIKSLGIIPEIGTDKDDIMEAWQIPDSI